MSFERLLSALVGLVFASQYQSPSTAGKETGAGKTQLTRTRLHLLAALNFKKLAAPLHWTAYGTGSCTGLCCAWLGPALDSVHGWILPSRPAHKFLGTEEVLHGTPLLSCWAGADASALPQPLPGHRCSPWSSSVPAPPRARGDGKALAPLLLGQDLEDGESPEEGAAGCWPGAEQM